MKAAAGVVLAFNAAVLCGAFMVQPVTRCRPSMRMGMDIDTARVTHTCKSVAERHGSTGRNSLKLPGAGLEERREDAELLWAVDEPGLEAPSAASLAQAEEAAEAESRVWQARATLVGVAALYGTNFGSVKVLQEALPPSIAAFLRFALAAAVFAPALRDAKLEALLGGLEVGAYVGAGYLAQSVALETTSASKSAFICSLAVIFVPLLNFIAEGRARGVQKDQAEGSGVAGPQNKVDGSGLTTQLAPALLAAAGVAALELGGLEKPNVGDVWSLLQPVCFGLGFWRIEKVTRRFPDQTTAITAAQLLSVALCAAAWAAWDASSGSLPSVAEMAAAAANWKIAVALVWTGVITTAFTVFLEAQAMKDLTAAESTVIFSTEPLWGAAFAAAVLGEHLGLNTAVGALLILSACVWSAAGPSLPVANILLATALGADVGENIASNVVELVQSFAERSGIE